MRYSLTLWSASSLFEYVVFIRFACQVSVLFLICNRDILPAHTQSTELDTLSRLLCALGITLPLNPTCLICDIVNSIVCHSESLYIVHQSVIKCCAGEREGMLSTVRVLCYSNVQILSILLCADMN